MADGGGVANCGVCLELAREPKETIRCGHLFCTECIRKWVETKGKRFEALCPICRAVVYFDGETDEDLEYQDLACAFGMLDGGQDRVKAHCLGIIAQCSQLQQKTEEMKERLEGEDNIEEVDMDTWERPMEELHEMWETIEAARNAFIEEMKNAIEEAEREAEDDDNAEAPPAEETEAEAPVSSVRAAAVAVAAVLVAAAVGFFTLL